MPSKYVRKNGKLLASRDKSEVSTGSRLIADLVAEAYGNTLNEHAHGKLLDLGCGKSPLYIAYKDLVTETVCADWPSSLHENPHLDLFCDLTGKLPFESGTFDSIILSDVLEHIPNPDQLCLELARILAPSGKVFINVPFFYWLHERPHDYYRYTEFALKRFIENSDMDLVHFQAIGGSVEVMADMLAKHLQFIPIIGQPLAIATQFLARAFSKSGLGKKLSSKTSEAFPYGYFLIAQKPESTQTT